MPRAEVQPHPPAAPEPGPYVMDEGTGVWVPKKSILALHTIKTAIVYASQHGLQPGDTFEVNGEQWYWEPDPGYIVPANPDEWQISAKMLHDKAKAAMYTWGSILHPSPAVAAAVEAVSDETATSNLAPMDEQSLFKMFEAAEGKTVLFMFMGHEVWPNQKNPTTGEKYPVWNLPDAYADGTTDGSVAIYPIWKKWKAAKQMATANNFTITVPLTSSGVVIANNTIIPAPPPFPGPSGKFPKWGPATAHFETKLAEALKLRLGPYATDSMVKEVVKDMLPVLHAYWEEVNSALVALKMTAAEQDTTVPTSIPGWTPTEAQKQVAMAEALHVEQPASAKMDPTIALWKAGLSPYLKKQYTQRIEFGIAVGALPAGTTLETPYIDLWVMAVKKHAKKGEPPMAEDYLAATKEWQQALEGVTA